MLAENWAVLLDACVPREEEPVAEEEEDEEVEKQPAICTIIHVGSMNLSPYSSSQVVRVNPEKGQ